MGGGTPVKRPKGVLLDYGGTLVEELGFDARAGNAWLLAHAAYVPPGVTLDVVMARAQRISAEVSERRDELGVEAPWPSLTRLIHDYFGTRFDLPMAELELGFWDASMTTRAMPGARETLAAICAAGVPMAVVSNASFGAATIRHELAKHGLADDLAFVMVSSDYVVRKPNPLLFDAAATRLGVAPGDIWFVGDRLDTDVAGAQAAGMVTVWLRPPNVSLPGTADLIVDSWTELRRAAVGRRP
jgi:putative hydrolase of the HAD superfamily